MEIIAPAITVTAVVLLIASLCWPSSRTRRASSTMPGVRPQVAAGCPDAGPGVAASAVSAETPDDDDDEPTIVHCIADRWGTAAWTIEPMLACGDSDGWDALADD